MTTTRGIHTTEVHTKDSNGTENDHLTKDAKWAYLSSLFCPFSARSTRWVRIVLPTTVADGVCMCDWQGLPDQPECCTVHFHIDRPQPKFTRGP